MFLDCAVFKATTMTKTLTFAETLHPEDATALIDPENRGSPVASPWTAVCNEVCDTPLTVLVVAGQVLIDKEDEPPRPTSISSAPHASHARKNI
jgi:hypothetical protein